MKNKTYTSKLEYINNFAFLTQNVDIGLPFSFFQLFSEGWTEKQIEGIKEDDYDAFYKYVDKYSYRVKQNLNDPNSDWKVVKASNWSSLGSTEKQWVYSFYGPGKLDKIDLIIPKLEDKTSSEEVSPFYYIIPRTTNGSYDKTNQINIDFFMALNNWNDRIWDDNN